ncbi:MAG: hypothetical protein K2W96_11970 [Gemmataceae bacterium]|nr:hypothetical protein [Gemmataceae bacterium]
MNARMLTALLLVTMARTAFGQETHAEVKKAALAAWKEQQAKLHSVRVKWVESSVQPAGSLSRGWAMLPGGRGKAMNPRNQTVPPADTPMEVEGMMELLGNKLRYESGTWQWLSKQGGYRYFPTVVVYDGALTKQLDAKGGLDLTWPLGHVAKKKPKTVTGAPEHAAICLALRPLERALDCVDFDEYQLAGNKPLLDGRPCLVLQYTFGSGGVGQVWLDPARGYAAVRVVSSLGSVVRMMWTVERLEQWEGCWIPMEWSVVGAETSGASSGSAKVRVVSIERVENDAERFKLPFPAGARVTDLTKPYEFQDYVVKPDLSPRVIRGGEYDKTYEELIHSEPPGPAGSARWLYWLPPWAVLVLLCLCWRRWRSCASE